MASEENASRTDPPIEFPEDHRQCPTEGPSDIESNKESSDTTILSEDLNHYPHGWQLILVASAPLASVFLSALDQTIVGTAIPRITEEFNKLTDVSWYAAAYFLTFGAAQPATGKIYKYSSLKWGFLGSMLIFEIGSLICGVAPSSVTLIVGRAIAGLGAAGISVGAASMVSFMVPPVQRPFMMGMIGFTYCISAVLGPLLGGVLTERLTWRWCFYINLPIGGIAATAVTFFFVDPKTAVPTKISWQKKLLHTDPVGGTLTMGAVACFILTLQYGGNTHPWNSSTVIGLLVGFCLLIIALIIWEIWLDEYSMILPRLLRKRSIATAAAYQFFFMGSYIVLLYYIPIYFQSVLGTSPIRSGVNNLPLVLSAAVFALVGGAVVMKTGRAQQVMLSGSAVATIAMGLVYTFDVGTSTAKWAGYQILLGGALAFSIMHGLSIAVSAVGPEDIAAATANLSFFQVIGGAFSTSAGQAAFVNQLLAVLPKMAPSVSPGLLLVTGASDLARVFPPEVLPGVIKSYMVGLKAAFAIGIAFSGTAFLVSLAIPTKKLPSHAKEDTTVALA